VQTVRRTNYTEDKRPLTLVSRLFIIRGERNFQRDTNESGRYSLIRTKVFFLTILLIVVSQAVSAEERPRHCASLTIGGTVAAYARISLSDDLALGAVTGSSGESSGALVARLHEVSTLRSGYIVSVESAKSERLEVSCNGTPVPFSGGSAEIANTFHATSSEGFERIVAVSGTGLERPDTLIFTVSAR